jgi:predicted  nucleic acid-binding Zn-ribbon protein
VRTELKEEIQGVRSELKETRDDLSSKIEAVGTKVEGHEDRIRFLERKVASI